jgi:hypothetical protein
MLIITIHWEYIRINPNIRLVSLRLGSPPSSLGLQADNFSELKMTNKTTSANTHLDSKARDLKTRLFWPVSIAAGVALFIAVYRFVNLEISPVPGMDPNWASEWAVIWIALAVGSLPLVLPLALNTRDRLVANDQAAVVAELMKASPSMRQEMMAMASRDHGFETQSVKDAELATDALAPLGGLSLDLRSRKESLESAYGLAKRPLLGYL